MAARFRFDAVCGKNDVRFDPLRVLTVLTIGHTFLSQESSSLKVKLKYLMT